MRCIKGQKIKQRSLQQFMTTPANREGILHQYDMMFIFNNDSSPGTQCCPDSILKNFIHPKESEDAPLIMELFDCAGESNC